jgi:hypothetical protein
MTTIKPAAAVKAGDTIELFGNGWTVRKVTRKGDLLTFYFKGVTGRGQIAAPDTPLEVRA